MSAASVAWLGAGRMGSAMAGRLLGAGVAVEAWNRTPGRLGDLLSQGATQLASPAAGDAPVVFSTVLDDEALDSLWQAHDGVLAREDPRGVWVDCSTVSPEASVRAADAAARAGTAFVCAPVMGNAAAVRAGSVVFAVSGPAPAMATVEPLLAMIGRGWHAVGGGHEARVVKLCANMILATHAQALAEALVLGESHGVARSALMSFINDSALGSAFTRHKTAAYVDLDLRPAFTADGIRKDLRLALRLGSEREVPLALASTAEVALSRLIASGLGDGHDFASLILLAALDAGRPLGPEPA